MARVFVVSRCFWTLHTFRLGLLEKLSETGANVTCAGAVDEYRQRLSEMGLRTRALPVNRRGISPLADVRLLVSMYRWYRAETPDVVHHFTIKPVIFGTIAARLARVQTVVNTITGLGYAFTESRGIVRRLAQALYRLALSHADTVFFQNKDDLQFFVANRLVSRDRCKLVPGSGVDLEKFRPHRRDRIECSIDCLMIARMLRDKGVVEFVEAVRIVRQKVPNLHCVILGGVDSRNPSAISSSQIVEWENEGLICWQNQVDDVRPFIEQSRIVVLPSYREGTPRSLLEAAAMGKPLITTDVVGCREVVADGINGLLVPVRDAAALADAMDKLLANESLRRRFGAAGRQRMMESFDENIVINRSIDAYGLSLGGERATDVADFISAE